MGPVESGHPGRARPGQVDHAPVVPMGVDPSIEPSTTSRPANTPTTWSIVAGDTALRSATTGRAPGLGTGGGDRLGRGRGPGPGGVTTRSTAASATTSVSSARPSMPAVSATRPAVRAERAAQRRDDRVPAGPQRPTQTGAHVPGADQTDGDLLGGDRVGRRLRWPGLRHPMPAIDGLDRLREPAGSVRGSGTLPTPGWVRDSLTRPRAPAPPRTSPPGPVSGPGGDGGTRPARSRVRPRRPPRRPPPEPPDVRAGGGSTAPGGGTRAPASPGPTRPGARARPGDRGGVADRFQRRNVGNGVRVRHTAPTGRTRGTLRVHGTASALVGPAA